MYAKKPLLDGPKRQHYLPKFYLEGFTKKGMLAVFDRERNEIRTQPPVNTCVIGHFYTLEDLEGRKRYELEQMLSHYEGKSKVIINKIESYEKINADERSDLAIFVALGACRTPDIIDSLKAFNSKLIMGIVESTFGDVDNVKERMRNKSKDPLTEEELELEAQALVEFVRSGSCKVKTSHKWAIGLAIRMSFKIAPILAGRDWIVIHRSNEKKSFVTTNAPVSLTSTALREKSIRGIGFASQDALVIFPLKQSCILVIQGGDGILEHRTADTEKIRRINLAIAEHCQRFVVGRDEALIKSLTRYLRLADKEWQPKMQLGNYE